LRNFRIIPDNSLRHPPNENPP